MKPYLPRAGDILWCRFPHVEQLRPAPKARPALVVSVMSAEDIRLRVAYGSSRKLRPLRRGEFLIEPDDGDAYQLAGLSFPTKFSLAQAVILPFTQDWFAIPPGRPHGACCKLGTLHPSLHGRVREAAAMIQGRR